MRILIANTRHFIHGGDSTYTFALAKVLRDAGHTVAFFAMEDERNVPDPNADLFVSHIDFREQNQRKGIRSGIQVIRRCIFSDEAAAKFSALVERFRPDVLHMQNIHAHLTPSIVLVADRLGIPIVWTMHDYKVMCPNSHFRIDATGEVCESCRPGQYHSAVLKRCKKNSILASSVAALEGYAHWLRGVHDKVNCFIAPSQFMTERLLAHGWPPERVSHVPYCLEMETGHRRTDEGKYFLFVGKLEALKGIHVLLDAAVRAPSAEILLVGSCDDESVRARLANGPANVRYLGTKNPDEVRRLMAGARAVLLPSIWYDNQPFVILESFTVAVPVIGTRIGGIPELVADGERGLLVEPGSVEELAAAIAFLEKEPARSISMGVAARNYVEQHHSAGAHLASISDIYHRATSTGQQPALMDQYAVTPKWI